MNVRRFFHFLLLIIMMATPSLSTATSGLSLNGEWQFAADSGKAGLKGGWFKSSFDRSRWQRVETPGFWEGYPGLATYDGWGWFARTFILDSAKEPLNIFFAGVDDDAEVWVNGKAVGVHTGYSEPFALDISNAVRKGENLVVVLVKDYSGGGGIYKPITIIERSRLGELLHGPYSSYDARSSTPWVKNSFIYSVYLRSFSPEGTFAGLERRLPELKDLGVTVLWLLPIHPVGKLHRKGTLGSPYAVQDYYGINPEFGTLDDGKHLLAAAHRLDMKLIIDLVANHTSWDSELMRTHPEWFTRDPQGNILPPNEDWTDVADLDYGHRGLRDYMIEMMRWWVEEVGIDGFRCDVAEMVPTEFWEEARARLDRIKPILMLSEGSLPEHHVKAFDLTYSWNIYDALDPLLKGKRPVEVIDQILDTEALQFPKHSLRMRFTTNHDKNAWDAPAVEKFGVKGLQVGVVLVNTLPGVPMIYTGEEVANNRKLDLFEKVSVDRTRPGTMGELWKTMTALRKRHPALREGTLKRAATTGGESVYAFVRAFGKDRLLVVLNFGTKTVRVSCTIPTSGQPFTGSPRDVFSGEVLPAGKSGTLALSLPGHGYKVLVLD